LRKVAVEADVDPRTVKAYVEGRRVRPAMVKVVAAALKKLGHSALVREGAAA
jgi:hypothetical protein